MCSDIGIGYFNRLLTRKLHHYWEIGLQTRDAQLCDPCDKIANFETKAMLLGSPCPEFLVVFKPIARINKCNNITNCNAENFKAICDIWQTFLEDTRIVSFGYANGKNNRLNYYQKNGFFYNYKNYNDNGLKKLKISDFLFKNILLEESIPNILKSGIVPIKLEISRMYTCTDENLLISIPSNVNDCDKKFEKLKMTTFEELVNNYIKSKQIESIYKCGRLICKYEDINGFVSSLKVQFKGKNLLKFNIVYPKICFNLLIENEIETKTDTETNSKTNDKKNNNTNPKYEKYIYFCDCGETTDEKNNNYHNASTSANNKNNRLYKVDNINKNFVEIPLNCESDSLTLRQLIGSIDSRIVKQCHLYEITHSQSRYLELSFDLKVNRVPFTDTIKVKKINDATIEMIKQNDSRCVICLESLNYDNYARLSNCIHKFHFDCICKNVALTQDNRCPLCRTQFNIIQQKKLIKEKRKHTTNNTNRNKNKNKKRKINSTINEDSETKNNDSDSSDDDDDEKSHGHFIFKAKKFNELVQRNRMNLNNSGDYNSDINGDNDRNERFYPQWMTSMNFFPNSCDNCNGRINVNDGDFDIDNYLHCVECRTWYCTSCTNVSLFVQCDQCMKCIHIDCANQNNGEWTRQRENWIHIPCQSW